MKINEAGPGVKPAAGRGETPAGREGRADSAPGKTAAGAANPASSLAPGRLLQGRVISFAGGRVALEVAGQRLEARSAVPLTPGREFWFEVRQAGSESRLVLADKQGPMYRFLQQAAGGFGDLGRLGTLPNLLQALAAAGTTPGVGQSLGGAAGSLQIGELLARLALGAESAPDKIIQLLAWLHPGTARGAPRAGDQWFRPGMGATLAPQAADLSRQLQALLTQLRQLPPGTVDQDALAVVGRVSGMLEAMVGLNEQPPPPNQPPFWLLPCFFALDAGAGSWLLSQGESGQAGGEAGTSLAFFLEMSRLGELQLQVRIQGGQLAGDFFLADAEAAKFLRGRLNELALSLENLGYQAQLRCHAGAVALLPALKEALEKAGGHEARKIIDVQA